MLVSDRLIEDDCLVVFLLWHDKPCMFMRMHGATFLVLYTPVYIYTYVRTYVLTYMVG